MSTSVDEVLDLLSSQDYVAGRSLATSVFLALKLGRPLFLEGEAGVGKTEVSKVLAAGLERRLIRLQCYEGLDVASALYEWDYARQMVAIRTAEAAGTVAGSGARDVGDAVSPTLDREALERSLFSERYLIERPLLQALRPDAAGAPVLLVDELDRADEPFEAFLLEILSDFQVSIPELGTIKAPEPPIVVLTSNRTREIHDAIKRRCLYHWIDYPTAERELEITRRKVPGASERLAREVVGFVQRLRNMELFKSPGIAETLDWSRALLALNQTALDDPTVDQTLGAVLKYQDDMEEVRGAVAEETLAAVQSELGVPSEP